MSNLFLLITIIRREDSSEYEDFYGSEGISVTYNVACNGTVHEKTLDLLGIERSEKAMLMSIVTGATLKRVCRHLRTQMKIDLPDRGVAVAVPLSGIGGSRILDFLTAEQNTETNEAEEVKEMNECTHELIVAIYEKGYTNMVMDAAREAGAGGGTAINARGTGAGVEKFFGLSIAEEKEIVLIVSKEGKKKDIMKAIMQKAGIDTKAHALVFSLPVSIAEGFRFADEVDKEEE